MGGEVTYQRERFVDVYSEAIPLLKEHWAEIATYLDIELAPDLDKYLKCEENGNLRIYTVRFDHKLIGYACFFVTPHAHYVNSLQALQDVLYLDPEYRAGRIGLNLIRFSEDELRGDGVQVVHQHVKLAHPTLGRILERLGYQAVETIYSRRLD